MILTGTLNAAPEPLPEPVRPPAQTVWQENAALAATSDREQHARLVLATARTEALELIVDEQPGRAQYVMARAVASASRILGEGVA